MHPGELAEMQLLQSIAEQLRTAPHGGRKAIVGDGAAALGVSEQTLYTRLRKVGFCSGRKLRRDKGDTRLSAEDLQNVAALMQASRRTTGKSLLPVKEAMDVAAANGLLKESVSPSTMLRVMRREGCHPAQLAQPTPHTSMQSKHPNHVWQLDASICVIYYLRGGKVGVMDERKFNARKPRDLARIANKRVLRYALTDHYTGDVIARYYHTAGEDQRTLFEFLMHAFHHAEGRVMHGVPWMLVWDAGSANQSHGISNLLTALGIRHWAHTPGNSRAKGQVECVHNIIERKYEGLLSFHQVESVEELNGHIDTWLRNFNGVQKHRRHGHTRDAFWQTIRADQLRVCPPAELCAQLMHSKPESRVVAGNLTISYKPRNGERATYSVEHIERVRVGDRLDVVLNPYHAPAIFVVTQAEDGSTRYIECEPIATNAAGFFADAPVFGEAYAAQADTDVDRARKDANERAYGERDTLDALAKKTKGAVAFGGAIDPFKHLEQQAAEVPAHMQRRGTELHLPNRMYVEERPSTLVELAYALRDRRGSGFQPQELERMNAIYPDQTFPQEAFDLLLEQLLRGELPALPESEPAPHTPRIYAIK